MKNFDQGTEEIAALKGQLFAQQALLLALLQTVPAHLLPSLVSEFKAQVEAFNVALLNVDMPERASLMLEQLAGAITLAARQRMERLGIREA